MQSMGLATTTARVTLSGSEPFERLAEGDDNPFPLALLSPQPARRLHSQLDHSKHSIDGKIDGRETLSMHPQAAEAQRYC